MSKLTEKEVRKEYNEHPKDKILQKPDKDSAFYEWVPQYLDLI